MIYDIQLRFWYYRHPRYACRTHAQRRFSPGTEVRSETLSETLSETYQEMCLEMSN
jgi:hypothetical protein